MYFGYGLLWGLFCVFPLILSYFAIFEGVLSVFLLGKIIFFPLFKRDSDDF